MEAFGRSARALSGLGKHAMHAADAFFGAEGAPGAARKLGLLPPQFVYVPVKLARDTI